MLHLFTISCSLWQTQRAKHIRTGVPFLQSMQRGFHCGRVAFEVKHQYAVDDFRELVPTMEGN